MLSDDVRALSVAVAELSDKVEPEVWAVLKGVKNNLEAVALGVEALENVPLDTDSMEK